MSKDMDLPLSVRVEIPENEAKEGCLVSFQSETPSFSILYLGNVHRDAYLVVGPPQFTPTQVRELYAQIAQTAGSQRMIHLDNLTEMIVTYVKQHDIKK